MPSLAHAPKREELNRLVRLFLQAETDIINEIGRLRSLGLADYHAAAALDRVQRILRQLESDCWQYVPKMVEREFYLHKPEARKKPEPAEKHRAAYQNAAALTAEQADIAQRLVVNLMGELTEATRTVGSILEAQFLGRLEGDLFRRIGLAQAAAMEAAGRGPYRQLNRFVGELAQNGVTAFVDKAGRRWSLHSYGAMALRTTSRQAEVLSLLTEDPEQDLYQISSHGTVCALCAPYEGRVYSRSGKDPDFPPLADAFGRIDPKGGDGLSNTYLNIHPCCLHVLLPWTPYGLSPEELQKIKDFSSPEKNPYTVDPRTQAQREAYRKKEAGRRRWLADYRQWERYRALLGEGCPKTFQTFQKHKLAGDEKYKLWRLDYRRRNELLLHPERALPGAAQAQVAEAKFTRYFFNPESKDGFPKGVAFNSRLGYNIDNWEKMQTEILNAARKYPATFKSEIPYGKKYEQMVVLQGVKQKPANVLLAWLVHPDGTAHFVTAHMEELKRDV